MKQDQPDTSGSPDWRAGVDQLAHSIYRDYEARVGRFTGGLGVWGSPTWVGYEIPLGGRVGRMKASSVRYAKKLGLFGWFGRRVQIRDLADVERQFREELDVWLAEQERRAAAR